jgi:hypothetical protein
MKLKQIASNMTELHLDNGTIVLFSYETPVAVYYEPCQPIERTKIIYSRTTTKHINKWIKRQAKELGQNEFEAGIDEVDQSVLDQLVSSPVNVLNCDIE